ncbi:hypothetical protein C9374_008130 [Naegleria lovaniensis]|uniref:Protein kinase domain-containing protein n=1 Tax=Naegleria lovaniensis TaxID=51637 RepID=A0AA88KHS5_NAELO|nr:uncharacterized protein C9374_008130 [Naegleria lovaniensis]KAG2378491.1 hypothetical protein C9374_008130 [Naegleria lovaniensis]
MLYGQHNNATAGVELLVDNVADEERRIMNSLEQEEYDENSYQSDNEYEDVLNTTQDSASSSAYLNQSNSDVETREREREEDSQEMLGLFLNFLRDNELNETAEKLMQELKSSTSRRSSKANTPQTASRPSMKGYSAEKVTEPEFEQVAEVVNDVVQSVVSDFYNSHQADTKHYNHRITPTNSAKRVLTSHSHHSKQSIEDEEEEEFERPDSSSFMKELQDFAHMYDTADGDIAPLNTDDLYETFEQHIEQELKSLELPPNESRTLEVSQPTKPDKDAKDDDYASDSDEEGYSRCSDFTEEDFKSWGPTYIEEEEAPEIEDRRTKWRPPVEYETIYLPVIRETFKTGFEETNEFKIEVDSIIAERYQVIEYLGSATFSRAIQCLDLRTNQNVCIKIIKNDKDFFDQSLDEIKLLRFLNSMGDPDAMNVIKLNDFFYYKEHLFIVCELLRDNLYEFYVYNRESGDELYFNLPRLQRITRQLLTALQFVHSLNLIHCDLKPENILIKSYSKCQVKIIDFGSSCFKWDNLPLYAQSRTYRAPEVVIGSDYDEKIDMWSLGCILAELFTGKVLFYNHSIQTMLAKILALCGPFKLHQLQRGRFVKDFFRKVKVDGKTEYVLFRYIDRDTGKTIPPSGVGNVSPNDNVFEELLIPEYKQNLKERLDNCQDDEFVDFIRQCLQIDPIDRLDVQTAFNHPWMNKKYEEQV